MRFIAALMKYDENHPFDEFVNEFRTSASTFARTFFTQSTLHRGICRAVGPFTNAMNTFTVLPGQLLIEFETKQPPAGTEQALLYPRPIWYAILSVNTTFVTPSSFMYSIVDPYANYQPGDEVALWFNVFHPACIIGRSRPSSGIGAINPHNAPMQGIRGFT